MLALLLLLPILSSAQEPSDPVDDEIVVVGDDLVEEAYEELIASFGRAGWVVHKVKDDGSIILRHRRDRWKGSFIVTRQGTVRTRRPIATDWRVSLPIPLPHPTTILPSKRKLKGPRNQTLAAIQPELQGLFDAHAEANAERNWDRLMSKLEALWERGQPLDGEGFIETHAERRAVILQVWASRTETDAGRTTMQRISDWIEATIQLGPHPCTAEEIERAERERLDGARLFKPPP